MKITNDLIGQVFNRLTIVEIVNVTIDATGSRGNRLICKCVCGNKTRPIPYHEISKSIVRSCGCIRTEMTNDRSRTHGMVHTKEYIVWKSMKARCLNPKSDKYKYYGGRGVSVCNSWLNSFENFFEDMGKKPSPEHSLDRIDNENGNYCKENCKWSTKKEQARNKSSNVVIEIDGVRRCASEWGEIYNLSGSIISQRIRKGWDARMAVLTARVPHGHIANKST